MSDENKYLCRFGVGVGLIPYTKGMDRALFF